MQVFAKVPCNASDTPFEYSSDAIEAISKSFPDVEVFSSCYPEGFRGRGIEDAINTFKIKIDSGACRLVSQFCFNVDSYMLFFEKLTQQGYDVGKFVIPGIIIPTKKSLYFAKQCLVDIPSEIERLVADGDSAGVYDSLLNQMRKLRDCSINTFQCYTLNSPDIYFNLIDSLLCDNG